MQRPDAILDAAIAHALDLFSNVKTVRARRMFGGAGLYAGANMFAIVSGDGIFLKADDHTKPEFEAAGSTPFSYAPPSGRKPVTMNYWRLPEAAADDGEAAMVWGQKAIDAALRAQLPAARRGPRA
jgi:DNA transformation protein and related proteins